MATTDNTAPALSVDGLSFSYDSSPVLRDVSLAINPGEVLGLLGPNGAGKSTLIGCLTGLLKPASGTVNIYGCNVGKETRAARKNIGYVSQESALDKILSAREHLRFQAALHHIDRKTAAARAEQLLSLVRLSERGDDAVSKYSGGMKKRLELACALVNEPGLLILDEPTAGLDIPARAALWQLIRDAGAKGLAVLLCSHYIEEVEELSDRVAIMDSGSLLACDTVDALKGSLGRMIVRLRVREFCDAQTAGEAKDAVLALPEVRSALVHAEYHNGLAIVLEHHIEINDRLLDKIRKTITDMFGDIYSLWTTPVSLSDVFAQATGHSLEPETRREAA